MNLNNGSRFWVAGNAPMISITQRFAKNAKGMGHPANFDRYQAHRGDLGGSNVNAQTIWRYDN